MHANKQSTLTLVLYLTLALALLSAHANPERRNHVNLKRILKKRAPQASDAAATNTAGGILGPLVGAQAAPTPATTSQTTAAADKETTAAADKDTTTSAAAGSITALPSISNILSSASSSSASSSSASQSSSSASSSSASLSSSSTTVSSTSASSTAPATTAEAATTPAPAATTSVVKGVTTLTTAVGAAQSTDVPQKQGAATKTKSVALTILIAVSASIGGIVILWTVFRKWKLGRSTKVDQRMQPIDWQPAPVGGDGIPGESRRLSGASFRSHLTSEGHGIGSDGGHSSHAHGGRGLIPDLQHDFTAGAAPGHLAPVGGYADLARGPSPQPQMQEMGQGGMTRPNYDAQVPLHHQGGAYGQESYQYRY